MPYILSSWTQAPNWMMKFINSPLIENNMKWGTSNVTPRTQLWDNVYVNSFGYVGFYHFGKMGANLSEKELQLSGLIIMFTFGL